MGFKGIVGHEDIIAHFKSSIETGNVAHAYIISGDAGSGKKRLPMHLQRHWSVRQAVQKPVEPVSPAYRFQPETIRISSR